MIKEIARRLLGFFYSIKKHRKISLSLSLQPGAEFTRAPNTSFGSLLLQGRLVVGEGSSVLDGARFTGSAVIGSYNKIGRNFSCHGDVRIGNYCAVAQDCFIISENHRWDLPALQIGFQRKLFPDLSLTSKNRVVLGHNVWLGKSVIILPGVTVGNGAIIGAGSVVTKDVAPYSVVGGNPARFIRFRFSPEVIQKIEASQWFMMSPKALASHRSFFSGENLDSFVKS